MKMNGVRGGEGLATYLMALLWVALMVGGADGGLQACGEGGVCA